VEGVFSEVRGYRVIRTLGSKIEGGERSSMSETTASEKPIEELEDAILMALDHYFEVRRSEVEESKQRAGSGFEEYEEARRKLAEVEQELEELRRRTEELKAEALGAVMGDEEVFELEEEVSELQEEVSELADAERAALERKKEAEERLWRAEQAFEGDLGQTANDVAAFALRKADEIDAFKGRVDQRFAKGRTSVLGAAI
jgi:chromosome segregation ATPase